LHRKRKPGVAGAPKLLQLIHFWPLVVLFSAALVLPVGAQTGPQGTPEGPLHRQVWLVPSQNQQLSMRTILFRPDGPGPFPLAIINHGSVESAELRAGFTQPSYDNAVQWFVRHGYVVALPLRPGHGETGGPYFETNGPCDRADFRKAGLATADSIQAAMIFLTGQSFVKKSGIVVVGHSAGGWGALALASRNLRQVSAVIAFAAGRGGRVNGRPNSYCAPMQLIDAARSFGMSARTPVLSLYAENDTVIGPDLARNISMTYRNAGGAMDYRALPAFGREGHALFEQGVDVWGPIVAEFLNKRR